LAAGWPANTPADMAAAIGDTAERQVPIPYPNPKPLHLIDVKRVTRVPQRPNLSQRR